MIFIPPPKLTAFPKQQKAFQPSLIIEHRSHAVDRWQYLLPQKVCSGFWLKHYFRVFLYRVGASATSQRRKVIRQKPQSLIESAAICTPCFVVRANRSHDTKPRSGLWDQRRFLSSCVRIRIHGLSQIPGRPSMLWLFFSRIYFWIPSGPLLSAHSMSVLRSETKSIRGTP